MALTKPRAHQLADLTIKTACRAVAINNINLTAAPSTLDGVSLATGNRILVSGQNTSSENGIYKVITLGTGSTGTWTRAIDADETSEIKTGLIIYVSEGTAYKDTQWRLITNDPIILGTSSLTFERVTTGTITSVTAGGGITVTGTGDVTVAINSNVVTLTGSQTLTNKTLTSPTITGADLGAVNGTFSGDVTITGDLTVNGATTTINTTSYVLKDPIMTMGQPSTTDDNKDRGIEFKWHNGTTTKTGFFGFDDSTGYFTFIPDAANTSEVFSGNAGTVAVNSVLANNVANFSASSITGNSSITVDTWDKTVYRSAKYEYQITQGTGYQVGEIRVFHDGTTATLNEYGSMGSELGTFTVSIVSGIVTLVCTVASSSTIKYTRKLIVI
jgi:hypothetical protein